MADDVRPTCERCRRPKASEGVALATAGRWEDRTPEYCWRGWFLPPTRAAGSGTAECDRLLLERAQTAERERDEFRDLWHESRGLATDYACERDALAEAGDRLADLVLGLSSGNLVPVRTQRVYQILAAWRSLRSPKGASNDEA